jgi:single-stranded DNA-specific DHH superfamily exonuclease
MGLNARMKEAKLETVITDHDLYHDSDKDKLAIVNYDTHEIF